MFGKITKFQGVSLEALRVMVKKGVSGGGGGVPKDQIGLNRLGGVGLECVTQFDCKLDMCFSHTFY